MNPRGETGGHFVVVLEATESGVLCVDGTTAETRQLSWRDFDRQWSGFVAHLTSTRGLIAYASAALLSGFVCGLCIAVLEWRRESVRASAPVRIQQGTHRC